MPNYDNECSIPLEILSLHVIDVLILLSLSTSFYQGI